MIRTVPKTLQCQQAICPACNAWLVCFRQACTVQTCACNAKLRLQCKNILPVQTSRRPHTKAAAAVSAQIEPQLRPSEDTVRLQRNSLSKLPARLLELSEICSGNCFVKCQRSVNIPSRADAGGRARTMRSLNHYCSPELMDLAKQQTTLLKT